MSKKSLATVALLSFLAITVPSFADHHADNGGGSPACSQLQQSVQQLSDQLQAINQTIVTNNTAVQTSFTQINSRLSTLNSRTNTTNTAITQLQTGLTALTAKVNASSTSIQTISTRLQDVVTRLTRIEASLGQQSCGTSVSASVNVGACANGATQCATADEPGPANQNPVEVVVSVLRNGQAVTDLTVSHFQILQASQPNGGPELSLCATGSQGCGTGDFFVNNHNGTYTLFVHPSAPWTAGNYSVAIAVNGGVNSQSMVDFTVGQ